MLSLLPLFLLAITGFGENTRPNIILLLADDMGYSDIGCFGGEIQTPNLDKLAREGIRLSHFYNNARCCPTRASLLTGVYPHQAGVGGMTDIDAPIPEYQGYLNNRVLTLGEALKAAGYATFLSGKWHVGEEQEVWPANRGFDRSYALIEGVASFFDFLPLWNESWPPGNQVTLTENGKLAIPPAGEFYATDLYTDKALKFIEEHDSAQPFFLYLGYTAPHWPLHALPEDIERYAFSYDAGWQAIQRERIKRLKEIGLIDADVPESVPGLDSWDALDEQEKAQQSQLMAVYAAMVDRMDQNIGRILEQLKCTGNFDNTLILFMSDNGAAKAGNLAAGKYGNPRFDPEAVPGSPESCTGYGPNWARVSNTPFRDVKATTYEGGVATPFIAWWPSKFPGGKILNQPAHVMDIMPTLLELAGGSYPQTGDLVPLEGQSLVQFLSNTSSLSTQTLAWEHIGNRAVLKGKWKLVSKRGTSWELFDLSRDRIEQQNMIDFNAETAKQMIEYFDEWSQRAGVLDYAEVEKVIPYKF